MDEDGDHSQVTCWLQISPDVIQENNLNPNSTDTSVTRAQAQFMHKGHQQRITVKWGQRLCSDDEIKGYFSPCNGLLLK